MAFAPDVVTYSATRVLEALPTLNSVPIDARKTSK